MLAKISSGAVLGVDAYQVEVEVDIANGVPSCAIVGLPDSAVNESKERVRSAVRNSAFEFAPRRITINHETFYLIVYPDLARSSGFLNVLCKNYIGQIGTILWTKVVHNRKQPTAVADRSV